MLQRLHTRDDDPETGIGLEVLEEIRRDADLHRIPGIMLTTSSSARDITA